MNDKAVALLRELAARSLDEGGFVAGECAWCGYYVSADGHGKDCKIAQVLAEIDSTAGQREINLNPAFQQPRAT